MNAVPMIPLVQPPLITLTTDFGAASHYVAQLKGVILGICRQAQLIDISHDIPPQDIAHAAWVLKHTIGAFPPNSFHLAVVDPGVGTSRRMVVTRLASQYFVAPDNGLLWPLAQQHAPEWIYELTSPLFGKAVPAPTFQGRDVMAPAVARLCTGTQPAELGPRTTDLSSLPVSTAHWSEQGLQGQVAFVDSFGNLITNIEAGMIAELTGPLVVRLPRQGIVCSQWGETYGQFAQGEVVALIGSTGQLELAVVNGHAARALGGQVGDPVVVCSGDGT